MSEQEKICILLDYIINKIHARLMMNPALTLKKNVSDLEEPGAVGVFLDI